MTTTTETLRRDQTNEPEPVPVDFKQREPVVILTDIELTKMAKQIVDPMLNSISKEEARLILRNRLINTVGDYQGTGPQFQSMIALMGAIQYLRNGR